VANNARWPLHAAKKEKVAHDDDDASPAVFGCPFRRVNGALLATWLPLGRELRQRRVTGRQMLSNTRYGTGRRSPAEWTRKWDDPPTLGYKRLKLGRNRGAGGARLPPALPAPRGERRRSLAAERVDNVTGTTN